MIFFPFISTDFLKSLVYKLWEEEEKSSDRLCSFCNNDRWKVRHSLILIVVQRKEERWIVREKYVQYVFTGTFYCLYRGAKRICVVVVKTRLWNYESDKQKTRKMGGMNRERKIEVQQADDEERESFRWFVRLSPTLLLRQQWQMRVLKIAVIFPNNP